ncbi:MAG: Asp-tRNA(Asn)/Glu-tRNA(Gln) amidotransferase subunit GatC [Patescibacteria group bacterium]|nr:Asp-tRNA(Asn)/Glu-tRNA(Gln) amidotransferase subunit GatC [Patescibacteria group bacterium]
MISKEEVKHIADLARLELTGEETDKMQKDLANILGYIEKLGELNVENVEPTFRPVAAQNVWREDEQQKQNPQVIETMLSQMPAKEGNMLKVREIFE